MEETQHNSPIVRPPFLNVSFEKACFSTSLDSYSSPVQTLKFHKRVEELKKKEKREREKKLKHVYTAKKARRSSVFARDSCYTGCSTLQFCFCHCVTKLKVAEKDFYRVASLPSCRSDAYFRTWLKSFNSQQFQLFTR